MLTQMINKCLKQIVSTKPSIRVLNQMQITRNKSIIKACGYKEFAPHKLRDIRYKCATWHRPKLMTWQDYQYRKFRAEVWKWRPYQVWQSKMDYAENLVKLGMSDSTITKMLDLHPRCVLYIKRKLNGNIELLRESHYCNFVAHRSGDK